MTGIGILDAGYLNVRGCVVRCGCGMLGKGSKNDTMKS